MIEKLNREDRYEIMRIIINNANPALIAALVKDFGYKFNTKDDIEQKRRELLEYLQEMNMVWNNYYEDALDEFELVSGEDKYRR